ncbi:MAG TPA: GDP-mannose 4,6-dehydratase [Chitinophagaceae bacterium]|jgi:GDPmannose 4,6-dehydratase|nr:GDP-mannose 4,6-dehydratase [Chitinophagaceae bacterium]
MKKALITGITGQDGAYLAEFLLLKGYEVHGIKRRTSLINTQRIDHLFKDLHEENVKMILHYGDLTDSSNIIRIIQQVQPDEIYNLGAMSHVQVSFEEPEYSANVDGLGVLRILEAVRILGLEKKTKIYQASSSELYGKVQSVPQNEQTPFYPRSPYAVAKLFAYWTIVNYREAYGLFACNGILFNHESPIRGETFVTRKITRGIAEVVLGLKTRLWLGNLDAERDWGHAKDYIEAMWLMLQQEVPEDFVIATGITTSVRQFLQKAFSFAGVEIEFQGQGINEKALVSVVHNNKTVLKPGDVVVEIDSRYFRPSEVDQLLGDARKAKEKLGWQPKVSLDDLIKEMVISDLKMFESSNRP